MSNKIHLGMPNVGDDDKTTSSGSDHSTVVITPRVVVKHRLIGRHEQMSPGPQYCHL